EPVLLPKPAQRLLDIPRLVRGKEQVWVVPNARSHGGDGNPEAAILPRPNLAVGLQDEPVALAVLEPFFVLAEEVLPVVAGRLKAVSVLQSKQLIEALLRHGNGRVEQHRRIPIHRGFKDSDRDKRLPSRALGP